MNLFFANGITALEKKKVEQEAHGEIETLFPGYLLTDLTGSVVVIYATTPPFFEKKDWSQNIFREMGVQVQEFSCGKALLQNPILV